MDLCSIVYGRFYEKKVTRKTMAPVHPAKPSCSRIFIFPPDVVLFLL
jgi:hypothetical protein